MEKLEFNKNEYSLSIRISPDGFSLYILDPAGAVLLSRNAHAPLFRMPAPQAAGFIRRQCGVTLPEYTETSIIIESEDYVFVPEPVFKPRHTDDYFYFLHERGSGDTVLFNRIGLWNTVNIFSMPAALNQALAELFPEAAVMHHLSHFISERITRNENSVHIWVRDFTLDAVVLKNGSLSLINSYSYKTKEDFAYYVLSIVDQMKFNAEEIRINLYQKDRQTAFKDIICMYVKNCEIQPQL